MIIGELREKALQDLKDADEYDTESAHIRADEVLCRLLTDLGYTDVVVEWNKIKKWYA